MNGVAVTARPDQRLHNSYGHGKALDGTRPKTVDVRTARLV